MDKQAATSRDAGVDTEAHLLFEQIPDLYDDRGQLSEKYRYLLQLDKNRGSEGSWLLLDKLKRNMPKYREIEFFDKFPAKGTDSSAKKQPLKVSVAENRDFAAKAAQILQFGDIAHKLSLKTINFSFTPKTLRIGTFHLTQATS